MRLTRTVAQTAHEKAIAKKIRTVTIANATHIWKDAVPCVLVEQGRGILSKYMVFLKEGKALAWLTNQETETIIEWTHRRDGTTARIDADIQFRKEEALAAEHMALRYTTTGGAT